LRCTGNGPVRDDLTPPLRFIGVAESLHVELFIEMFEELKTDDAVVGATVEGDGCGSFRGILAVDAIDAIGVEDFIYAGELSVTEERQHITYDGAERTLTMDCHH
jgi:hypothetical protein